MVANSMHIILIFMRTFINVIFVNYAIFNAYFLKFIYLRNLLFLSLIQNIINILIGFMEKRRKMLTKKSTYY